MTTVALFIPTFHGGGAERAMISLAGGFAAAGLKVDLIVAHNVGPLAPLVPANVRVVDLHVTRVAFALPALVKYLRTNRPALIYATLAHANVVTVLAARLARVGTRVALREAFVPVSGSSYAQSFSSRVVLALVKWIYPMADAVIAVSTGIADELRQISPALKICVLPNPVFDEDFDRRMNESPSNHWLQDESIPVVLGAGRLSRQKDFPTLIRSFAKVVARTPARLIIIGEGEDRAELEKLIAESGLDGCAALPGFVENPLPYMKAAKVFVLSSLHEGMPNALLQAMGCGTAVVSTDCKTGPREIVVSDLYGRLVNVGDVDQMSLAIEAALSEKPKPEVAREIRDRFGLVRVVREYLAVLNFKLPSSPVTESVACQ